MAEKTVLVVDDDTSVLLYLEQVLKGEGYRVLTVPGAEEARGVLTSETPDLLLLDVQMPGMGGYDLLEALREEDRTARIPVMFLTVKDTPSEEARGLKEGVADYLSKDILTPDRVEILLYRLRNFFDRQENERLRGVLATVVSANHEINNPLMVVLGSTDLLRLKGVVGAHPESQETLDRIAKACHQIKEVLQRISTLTAWEVKPYLEGVEMLDLGER